MHDPAQEQARYQEAMLAALESMAEAASSGRAATTWSREEIYDRHRSRDAESEG